MNIKQINFAWKHAAYCNYYRNFASSKTITPRQVATVGAAAAGIPGAYVANQYLQNKGYGNIIDATKNAYNTMLEGVHPARIATDEAVGAYLPGYSKGQLISGYMYRRALPLWQAGADPSKVQVNLEDIPVKAGAFMNKAGEMTGFYGTEPEFGMAEQALNAVSPS
jgi:hypothetical protein